MGVVALISLCVALLCRVAQPASFLFVKAFGCVYGVVILPYERSTMPANSTAAAVAPVSPTTLLPVVRDFLVDCGYAKVAELLAKEAKLDTVRNTKLLIAAPVSEFLRIDFRCVVWGGVFSTRGVFVCCPSVCFLLAFLPFSHLGFVPISFCYDRGRGVD